MSFLKHSSCFLLVLFLTTSCLNSKKSDERQEIEKEPTEKVPQKSVSPPEKAVAKNCEFDNECETYFRCIEAKCTIPPAISGAKTTKTPTATIKKMDGSSETFHLELAVSMTEMTRGLMYRKTMRDDWGMLFIYDDISVRSFWMKNTLIPLDMLFINEKGIVVGIVEGAEPLTRKARTVNKPAKYVLELNAGRSKALGIKPGDSMTLTKVEVWQDIEK